MATTNFGSQVLYRDVTIGLQTELEHPDKKKGHGLITETYLLLNGPFHTLHKFDTKFNWNL